MNCERINSLSDLELNIEIANYITNSNNSGDLCPQVEMKNGKTKTVLFSIKSLAKFYALNNCNL